MRVFFDTSVLVAASVRSHEQHASAHAAMERVIAGTDEGIVADHSLAELYAVLTRLPLKPRIQPEEASRIILENVSRHFRTEALGADDYKAVAINAAKFGVAGGAIYDALILASVEKAKPDRIYTFNVADFRRLAPGLREIIASP